MAGCSCFDEKAHETHKRQLTADEAVEADDRLQRYADIEVRLDADKRSQVFTTVYKVVHGEAYHVRSDGSLGQSWTELFKPTQVHDGYQPMTSGFVDQSLSVMSQAINNNSVCRAIWFSPAQHPNGTILCADTNGKASDRSYGSELIAFRNSRGELMISVTQFEAPSDPVALRQEILKRTGVDLYDAKNGNADGSTGFKVHIVEGTRTQGDTVQTSYWKGAISIDNPGRPSYAGEGRYLDPFADRIGSREVAAQLQPSAHQRAHAYVPENTQNAMSSNSLRSINVQATNVQNNQSSPHQSSPTGPAQYHERTAPVASGNVSAFPAHLEKTRDAERLPAKETQQSNHVVFTPARLGEEIAHPHQARNGVFMDNSARIGFSSHLGDSIVVRIPASQVLASELSASEQSTSKTYSRNSALERAISKTHESGTVISKEQNIPQPLTPNRETQFSPVPLNVNSHHGERARRGLPIVPAIPASETPLRNERTSPHSSNHSLVSRNDRNHPSQNTAQSALTRLTQRQPSVSTRGSYSKRPQGFEDRPSPRTRAVSRRSTLTSLKTGISASKRLYRRPHTSTQSSSRRNTSVVASSRATKSRSLYRVTNERTASQRNSRLHRLAESLRRTSQRMLRKRGANAKDPVQKLQAAKNRQKTSARTEHATTRIAQHRLTKLLHSIRHMTLRKAVQSLVRAGLASQGRKDDVRLLKVLAMKLLRNLIQNLPGNAQLRRSILNTCSINELMFLRLTLMKRSRARKSSRSNYFELDADGQRLLLEFEELLESLVHTETAGIESSEATPPDQETDETPVFGYMADTTGPETFLKTVRMKQT